MVLMQKKNTEVHHRRRVPVGLTDLSLVIPPEASSLSAISLPFATVKTASTKHEPKNQAGRNRPRVGHAVQNTDGAGADMVRERERDREVRET